MNRLIFASIAIMAVYFLVMGIVFPDTMSLTEKKITSPFFVTSLDNQSISSGESIDLIIDSGVTGGDSDMLILIIGFPDAKSFDEIKIKSSEFTQSVAPICFAISNLLELMSTPIIHVAPACLAA